MTFTPEQDDLRAGVRKLLDREAEPWPALCAQIGIAALLVPERFGGFATELTTPPAHSGQAPGLTEAQIVAEELGRHLADVPFLGSSVLAVTSLLTTIDTSTNTAPDALSRLLPPLATGSAGALAWTSDGRWDTHQPAFTTDGSTVDGIAHYVLDAAGADLLLAAARTPDGPALFEVDPAHSGVRCAPVPTMDETCHLATVTLDHVRARPLGPVDLARVRDVACAVLAAEQAGAAAQALDLTVEYTQQRVQFGRPIGSFQALKHRMADLHVQVETARSAAYAAPRSSRLAAVAKVHCSEVFTKVAAEMIQLHGGIAITWDHPAHRYLKRAHATAQLFGAPHHHLSRVHP
ncbi:acyl-CoA dehydrogenase family protein [Amycolatopsis rhabdoformis]|uniref:Acyl-CoA dehydrogenase family protein n=1 Tax=Amycolatopsis rhabdoformis TaxID=1448059 RepID=A0ABZ1I9K1_9PSEU|nr:acyl-CoA dehydrogenase family protein [Amycolatopsis rhabdoformis]WSE30877.1 acyl-CoA dehydrogenase family protein [Amycolatopsis rhabdoformis]